MSTALLGPETSECVVLDAVAHLGPMMTTALFDIVWC